MVDRRYHKKPAPPVGDDWHSADVVAALVKAGWSLRRLSLAHGLAPRTLGYALHLPYHRGERIIATTLGLQPQDIWPSRYFKNGQPKPIKRKCTPARDAGNTKAQGAL